MRAILISLFTSLALTLAVELLLALLLGVRKPLDLLTVALVNILTNPAVNYCSLWAFSLFGMNSAYTILIIVFLEIAAVTVEFLLYRQLLSYDRIGSLKLSLLLNGASFITGLIVSGVMRLVS